MLPPSLWYVMLCCTNPNECNAHYAKGGFVDFRVTILLPRIISSKHLPTVWTVTSCMHLDIRPSKHIDQKRTRGDLPKAIPIITIITVIGTPKRQISSACPPSFSPSLQKKKKNARLDSRSHPVHHPSPSSHRQTSLNSKNLQTMPSFQSHTPPIVPSERIPPAQFHFISCM
ncbi:hypothetical protein BU24DRAFT_236485 [Aaosphaeria arxii CBS 175.79]|uniref:Uncharacterized protein n=1 Tax=Aaosphaeria arxii CBS 175.79 TaxID=1450172 RepID=A0A6A5XJD1_9PLEO|nr:uncharacterized protein BU24DRAFT_236485 [Aaosphaeria arxii CBS 175.79]KAF2013375.1 hypothetical protein BU24DRAFT_236485 [Aaosphaeria arxii CBS 175.79]